VKILIASPTYVPFIGGTRTFLENMARRLVVDGHRVTVLTTNAQRASDFWQPPPPTRHGLSAREVLDGVVVERLALRYPWPAPYRFGLLRRVGLGLQLSGLPAAATRPIQRRLSRWMPPLEDLSQALQRLVPAVDLVHADDSSWDGLFVAAACAADHRGKPLVVRPLMHLGSAWVQAHYQMPHQAEVYRAAAVVLALSQVEAAAYSSCGVAASRQRILPMGVEPGAARSLEDVEVESLEPELVLQRPVVAFVGANTYDKGAFALAEAVIQLVQEGMSLTLVCVGPQEQVLSAFLRRQPPALRAIVRDHVRVLGVVSEMTKHRLLAACDLLALPSQVDTFGIVLLEAWLHRKPVIGARAGGIPEVIRHEENGLLVPFGDVDALAAAIRRLLENPDWAAQLAESGYESLAKYTWDRTYETLLEAYSLALARGS
jgi:glycosyltransferase involved in cell wall biosynthesis